jgi:hypothetical protein
MKASEIKNLIRESLLEIETSKDKMKKPSSSSGAMTPEEEKMIADYEEEMANKYAVGPKEEPELEEGKDVMSKAREIVSKHKGMMNEDENINSHSIKWNYPDTDPDSEDFYYESNPESRNYTISLPIYGTGPDGTMYKGLYVADVKSIEALDDLDIDPAKIDNIRRAEMNENEDSEDMYSYDKEVMEKGKARQLKSKIIDAIDMIDPELHVETFAKVIANIVASEYGEHLYEDFLNALKAQTGSMTEGKEVVRQANRIVESWKKGKALVESKKAKRSKMMKENKGGVKTFTIGNDAYKTYGYDIDALEDDAKEYLGTYDGGIKGYDGDESVDTGADYQWAIARGDDFPNAIIVKNPAILKDEAAMGFIRGLKAGKHSKMMKENEGSVRDQISDWYHKTNFYIDEKSPEEIEDAVNAHYDEYMAVKDQYNNIEDYFEDVEKNGDWY